ncbi:Hypothetical protein, putative [Bodo saltans]|uniref:IQ motif and ubiquitin-like domain-containing protein n=1 Tax=Bodo saltans TaxID=75058 RepID=A0A0S4KLK4_BODSA|nr:Hypothetical protein, putative [Bodo saltans]|eukprot:CUI15502.1 Hypothetical protein, putative [Bodo saltans]
MSETEEKPILDHTDEVQAEAAGEPTTVIEDPEADQTAEVAVLDDQPAAPIEENQLEELANDGTAQQDEPPLEAAAETTQNEAVAENEFQAHPEVVVSENQPQQETAPPFFADPTEGNLIIRFTARPEGFYFQHTFPTKSPCLIMYKRLESQLFLNRRNIQLYWEGRPLSDTDVPADVCILPDSDEIPLFLDLEIEQVPEHLQIVGAGEQVSKVIRTQVQYGEDIPQKQFFVSITKGYDRKPFIGGWRHKAKPVTYHNATTQCSADAAPVADMSGKICRTTQTNGVTRSCQTRRECGTQMPKPDVLVDDTYDRVRVARPYFSAERLLVLRTQKTILLQAFVRGWRARKIARGMRNEREAQDFALAVEDVRRREEHENRRQDEIQRRTHPTTAQDFNVLHNELEAWRLQEVERINAADISDAERRVAMQELLKKQTKLLQTIDRLQIQATKENRFRKINTTLNKMSSAKVWGSGVATVNVETPFTVRARELRDLYDGLQLTHIGIDERLDILLHVKWTVKEFECALTREIVELIDREADLLNRGRREKSLGGLRQRLSNLFLQFVETPEFNPEAAQFQRVPLEYTSRPLVKLDKK